MIESCVVFRNLAGPFETTSENDGPTRHKHGGQGNAATFMASANPFSLVVFAWLCLILQVNRVTGNYVQTKSAQACGHPGTPAYGRLLEIGNSALSSSIATNVTSMSSLASLSSRSDQWTSTFELPSNQTRYAIGEIVSYSCSVGHLMVGLAHRKCLPDGRWSGRPPVCDTLLPRLDSHGKATLMPLSVRHVRHAPPALAIDQLTSTCFQSEKFGHRALAFQLAKRTRIIGLALSIPKSGNLNFI